MFIQVYSRIVSQKSQHWRDKRRTSAHTQHTAHQMYTLFTHSRVQFVSMSHCVYATTLDARDCKWIAYRRVCTDLVCCLYTERAKRWLHGANNSVILTGALRDNYECTVFNITMQLIIYYQKQQRRGLFVVTSIHIHSSHARTRTFTHTLERRRDSQCYVRTVGICFFQVGWIAAAPAPMHSPSCQVVFRLSVLLSVDSTIFRVNERQKMCFACWRHVPSNSLLLALFLWSRHLIFGLSSRITCIHSQQFRSIGFCSRSTTNGDYLGSFKRHKYRKTEPNMYRAIVIRSLLFPTFFSSSPSSVSSLFLS